MYGIFRVDSNFQVVLSKDAARLCPELVDISEDELKYIILAYDYIESPFRKKPLEERKRIAKRKTWKNSRKNPESQKVKKAIDAYKGLIYDSKREAVESYKQKVANLNREISASNDIKEIKEKVALVEFFEKKIYEYENDIKAEEVNLELKLKGDTKLSYLEIWQRNQKAKAKEQKLLGEDVEE